MVAVVLSLTGGGVLLGAVVIARHRAQAAADLAALAATCQAILNLDATIYER
jgi:uncharacterized membrane protein